MHRIYVYRKSRGVSLEVLQRRILSPLTDEISFGQLPRLVHHELMPCLRRGTRRP